MFHHEQSPMVKKANPMRLHIYQSYLIPTEENQTTILKKYWHHSLKFVKQIFVKHKYLCLTHSKQKQTKNNKKKLNHWSLEQRKAYCKGQARRTGNSCSKNPNSLTVLREEFLQVKFGGRVAGCITLFCLVGGEGKWYPFRNLNHQPSASNQSGVLLLMLSLKVPSSPGCRPLFLQKS